MVRILSNLIVLLLGLVIGCSEGTIVDGLTGKNTRKHAPSEVNQVSQGGSHKIDSRQDEDSTTEPEVNQPTEVGGSFLTAALYCAYENKSDGGAERPFNCRFESENKLVEIPATAQVELKVYNAADKKLAVPMQPTSSPEWQYKGLVPEEEANGAYVVAHISYPGASSSRRAPILDHILGEGKIMFLGYGPLVVDAAFCRTDCPQNHEDLDNATLDGPANWRTRTPKKFLYSRLDVPAGGADITVILNGVTQVNVAKNKLKIVDRTNSALVDFSLPITKDPNASSSDPDAHKKHLIVDAKAADKLHLPEGAYYLQVSAAAMTNKDGNPDFDDFFIDNILVHTTREIKVAPYQYTDNLADIPALP